MAAKTADLEILHRNFAVVGNFPFGLIPLLLSESSGHLID